MYEVWENYSCAPEKSLFISQTWTPAVSVHDVTIYEAACQMLR